MCNDASVIRFLIAKMEFKLRKMNIFWGNFFSCVVKVRREDNVSKCFFFYMKLCYYFLINRKSLGIYLKCVFVEGGIWR